ncbi:MAG: 4'-phosphopantetheinyl transferase superfamily protein [Saprospiraceae bacterium]
MHKVYHANTTQYIAGNPLESLYKDLPKEIEKRALRFRFPKDAYNFVVGRLLLQKGLRELGMSDDLSKMTYQENGKPEMEGLWFNISHSAHQVVCVLSTEGPIGIDIEVRSDIELSDFVNYFTEQEWLDIQGATDPLARFYFYWTRKEAVIKALGVNLSWLHEIELDATGRQFYARGRQWTLASTAFRKFSKRPRCAA